MFRRGADITSAKSCREKLCSGWLVGIQRGPLRDPSPRSEQCAVKHGRAPRFPCPAPTHHAARKLCEKSREPRLLISRARSTPGCISRTLIESTLVGPLRCTVPLSNVHAFPENGGEGYQDLEIRPFSKRGLMFNLTRSLSLNWRRLILLTRCWIYIIRNKSLGLKLLPPHGKCQDTIFRTEHVAMFAHSTVAEQNRVSRIGSKL